MSKTIKTVIAVLIGYFIAMMIRSATYNQSSKTNNQVTFAGIVGAFLTTPGTFLNSTFIGLTIYDLGHEAGPHCS